MVVLMPEPLMFPGLIIQFPEGNPLKTTLPVSTSQVGWVIVPTVGASGVAGWSSITTSAEAGEVQPAELVTVKL